MRIEVYGQQDCSKCTDIKNKIDGMGLDYSYVEDREVTNSKALELRRLGGLVEMMSPIVIVDGVQVKHRDVDKIKIKEGN